MYVIPSLSRDLLAVYLLSAGYITRRFFDYVTLRSE